MPRLEVDDGGSTREIAPLYRRRNPPLCDLGSSDQGRDDGLRTGDGGGASNHAKPARSNIQRSARCVDGRLLGRCPACRPGRAYSERPSYAANHYRAKASDQEERRAVEIAGAGHCHRHVEDEISDPEQAFQWLEVRKPDPSGGGPACGGNSTTWSSGSPSRRRTGVRLMSAYNQKYEALNKRHFDRGRIRCAFTIGVAGH